MDDSKLWTVFSIFIRLRDSNANGIGRCFTCHRFVIWNKGGQKYGPETWNILLLKSRQPCHWSQFEIDALTEHYKKEVKRLARDKMFVVKI
jgi:hypothetical protein